MTVPTSQLRIIPAEVHTPIRFVIGRQDKRTMPQKDDQGRVKVYRDKNRCWKEGRAAFPPHVPLDVFGMDAESWKRFKEEVKHIEVDANVEEVHPQQDGAARGGSDRPDAGGDQHEPDSPGNADRPAAEGQ